MEIQTKVKAMEIQTKVTRIGKRWHCRIFNSNKVLDEMACDSRLDIGFCFRYMLRWHDKMGGVSKMASASRHRGKNHAISGRVWYNYQLGKSYDSM